MAVPVVRALLGVEGSELQVVVKNRAIAEFGKRVIEKERAEWYVKPASVAGWLKLMRRLRKQRPSAFFGVHAMSRLAGAVALFSGAPVRVGPIARYGYNVGAVSSDRSFGRGSTYDERRHKVRLYLDFLSVVGMEIDAEAIDTSVEAPNGVKDNVMRRFSFLEGTPIMGIAPSCGAQEAHKRWSPESLASVVQELGRRREALRFVILGGVEDRPVAREIMRHVSDGLRRDRVHDLTGETDLVELLAVLERLSTLVTVCNGPSHVAAAVDLPIVGLYGPTNPGFTGPYSNRLYAIRMGYGCSPCYRSKFRRGCGNPRCMSDIQTGEVVAACERALDGVLPDPVPELQNSMAWSFAK